MAKGGKVGSVGFSQKWLGSEIGKVERERAKQRRQEVAKLRKALKDQMRAARVACKESIRQALEEADQSFKQGVGTLRAERRTQKGQLRGRCRVGSILGKLERAHSDPAVSTTLEPYAQPALEPLRGLRSAEQEIAEQRRLASTQRTAARKERTRSTAAERLAEHEEDVLREIPEALHGLWNRMKGAIKSSARKSRAEAFQEWIEANPQEVAAYQAERERDVERELERQLWAEQARRELEAEIAQAEKQEAPEPKGPGWGLASVRGVRAERLTSPQSSVLDEMIERAAIDGESWMAWRVGDLEVLRKNGHVHIAAPGAPVASVKLKAKETIRAAVERWLKQQKPQEGAARPFSGVRGRRKAAAPVLPEAIVERPGRRSSKSSNVLEEAPARVEEIAASIAHAAHAAATEAPTSDGVRVEERDGVLRVQFEHRPRVEVRERLKRAGFRWRDPAWEIRATDEAHVVAREVAELYAAPAPGLSEYEAKRLARVERLKTRAERARKEAIGTIEQARKMAAVIPFGEPIHVGHHSEGRDRRYRAKVERTYAKGFTQMGEAEVLQNRAEGAARNTAISSDDPDAVAKLRTKLDELERTRNLLPAARNVLARCKNLEHARAEIIALGLDEDLAARLTSGGALQRYAYRTAKTNVASDIQRVRRRIADLEERQARPTPAPAQFGDARVVEEENRVRIYFAGRPDEETRRRLRSHGFLWAPSVGAWQRKPSSTAWYWARNILAGRQTKPAEAAVLLSPVDPEPPPAAKIPSGRQLSAAERTSSLFGPGGPVPPSPTGEAAPATERRTDPDWHLTAWERTPSLFGTRGAVPPPPGEKRVPPQTRLRFS